MNLPYAEDINYWQSGKSSPDVWLEKIERMIEGFEGKVRTIAMGKMEERTAYLIEFTHSGDTYRIMFPVLPTKNGDKEQAARRQAATLLYHDVKARLLRAEIFTVKSAFFEFLLLPDGRTVSQVAVPELLELEPKLLR